jgi:hypothetical protein
VRARCLLVLLATLLVACGGDDRHVAWRDLTLELPDGWSVFEHEDTRLSIANVPLGDLLEEGAEQPEGDVVAMFFTYEAAPQPGDWRRYVDDRDAQLEVDQAIDIAGVPATRLQILDAAGGAGQTVTRELVVVVPARGVVLLAQPVPALGDDDVTAVFDRAVTTFDAIIDTIAWGAPLDTP